MARRAVALLVASGLLVMTLTAARPAAAQTLPEPTKPVGKTRVDELMRETERDRPFVAQDPRPGSGVPYIIAGGAALGIGVLSFGYCAMFQISDGDRARAKSCAPVFAGLAIGGVFVGTPLMLAGMYKQGKLRRWRRRHPVVAALLDSTVDIRHDAVTLSIAGRF